jgi:hypothetical protein
MFQLGAKMRNFCVTMTAATALFVVASPASAAITICSGGGCAPQPSSNVLVDMGVTGLSVSGTLNNAPGIVTFSSLEQLINNANGQARIGAVDGVLNNALTIQFTGGLMTAFELNINALTAGTVSFGFTGGDSNGFVTGPFLIGSSGSNFFDGYNGTFSSLTLLFGGGATIQDVRQVRLNTSSTPAVPEPATWALMLLGFGFVGATMRKPKQHSALRYDFA